MALSISLRGSAGHLSSVPFCTHHALSHLYRSRLCLPYYLCSVSTSTYEAPRASVSDESSSFGRSKGVFVDDSVLSLTRLDSVVDKAARKKGSVKCKVRPASWVDTRSFPFAEKDFAALKLSGRVLQRLKQERLEVPTDVQVSLCQQSQLLFGADANWVFCSEGFRVWCDF